jgi:hypothetical protein
MQVRMNQFKVLAEKTHRKRAAQPGLGGRLRLRAGADGAGGIAHRRIGTNKTPSKHAGKEKPRFD